MTGAHWTGDAQEAVAADVMSEIHIAIMCGFAVRLDSW